MQPPFTIYLLQSAHTDIGYTHPQEQIARMYIDFYDRLLELCRQSEADPEPHRFKWICETAWQVRNYVTARPEREDEFLHYVRAGQIEIVGNYLHYSDLIDPDAYERGLQWAVRYCAQHDLPLRCIFHCDINGWPWAIADLAARYGLTYFCSQVHVDSATDPLGQCGSIHYHWKVQSPHLFLPDAPFRIPQAFWWQGPGGGQVLHWLGEHYALGNVLGLSGNHEFPADKTRYYYEGDRTSVDELYQVAKREVPRYVEALRHAGYAYDKVLIGTGGVFADNAPPDQRWCSIIKRWNTEHADILLRTTTLSEWFAAIEPGELTDCPTRQSAWPDHWSHGLGTATARIAQARRNQRRRPVIAEITSQSHSPQAMNYLQQSLDQEQLALEHTFSAWSTTMRPNWNLNDFQQAAKELYFHRTEHLLDEAATAALRAIFPTTNEARLHVYAPAVSPGRSCVHFDGGDWAPDPQSQVLVADDGQSYRFQLDAVQPDQYIAVLPVDKNRITTYRLIADQESVEPSMESPIPMEPMCLETEYWRLCVDSASGGLISLHEKTCGHEWVNPEHDYRFGQLVHQSVVHPRGREAVGNFSRWIAQGVASDETRSGFPDGLLYKMTPALMNSSPRLLPGPVFDTLELQGALPGSGEVRIAWRAFHDFPLVELVVDWDKAWHDRPEAAYVAFPFAGLDLDLALETSGGFFTPGSFGAGGQIPGTCSTYYTTQRGARIRAADDATLYWLPMDAPLVMTNSLEFARWEIDPWRWNGFLASMPVNHYWHTNFAISQRGHLRLRYRFLGRGAHQDDESALLAALPLDALGWR